MTARTRPPRTPAPRICGVLCEESHQRGPGPSRHTQAHNQMKNQGGEAGATPPPLPRSPVCSMSARRNRSSSIRCRPRCRGREREIDRERPPPSPKQQTHHPHPKRQLTQHTFSRRAPSRLPVVFGQGPTSLKGRPLTGRFGTLNRRPCNTSPRCIRWANRWCLLRPRSSGWYRICSPCRRPCSTNMLFQPIGGWSLTN